MTPTLKDLQALLVKGWTRASAQDIGLGAAGVAYFGILSIAPSLAAVATLYGLFGDPATVQRQAAGLRRVLPPDVANFVDDQMLSLVNASAGTLAWSTVAALVFAIWSANRGVDGFLQALRRIEGEAVHRSFLKQTLVSLAFTASAVLLGVVTIGVIAIAPAAIAFLPLGAATERLVDLARWPLLFAATFGFVAALYRWGPNRPPPPWRPVLQTAAAATIAWVLGSMALSAYVAWFGQAGAAQGSLAGAAGLLLWLFVSAYVFLFGGALIGAGTRRPQAPQASEASPRPAHGRPGWSPPQLDT